VCNKLSRDEISSYHEGMSHREWNYGRSKA
jgi:hypothetical protein